MRLNSMGPTFYTRFGKRWFDAIVSSIGLIVLSPLLIVVAIGVRLSSPGPAFFSQVRTGQFGKPFRILKFRTMRMASSDAGSLLTASGDPRITPLGRWLRKTKIDELPQLLNVVAGQISLVGPRPEVPLYTATYTDRQKQVLLVRPGITSPKINFDEEELLAGHADKQNFYLKTVLPAKLEIGLSYGNDVCFWSDLKIIFQTVEGVLGKLLDATEIVTRRLAHHPRTVNPDSNTSTPIEKSQNGNALSDPNCRRAE
jgi:lipopolysaccharide/colanic/teichoic acid biosynthesis glycosyltransferase